MGNFLKSTWVTKNISKRNSKFKKIKNLFRLVSWKEQSWQQKWSKQDNNRNNIELVIMQNYSLKETSI